MVAVVNTLVFLGAVVVAAVLVHFYPAPREARRKRWGWGFRAGPFFFFRR